ncbi:uncharacterized protein LOC419389 isoform X5 [Gallus gallus]|uniref:uncharacterized protein LOC419389 isoform X5 n=1 Tax=Gallus gallus TaxID=9031 RepID=UPI001AEB62DD|nr:uncharacterized protein LOC419389 isoform X5 [Gallus gallus]
MERGKARAFANLPENKGVRGRADGRAPAGEPRAQPPLVRPEPQVGPGAALPLRCDLRLRPGATRGPAGIGARVRGTAAEREPEHNPASGGREGAATCRPNAEANDREARGQKNAFCASAALLCALTPSLFICTQKPRSALLPH